MSALTSLEVCARWFSGASPNTSIVASRRPLRCTQFSGETPRLRGSPGREPGGPFLGSIWAWGARRGGRLGPLRRVTASPAVPWECPGLGAVTGRQAASRVRGSCSSERASGTWSWTKASPEPAARPKVPGGASGVRGCGVRALLRSTAGNLRALILLGAKLNSGSPAVSLQCTLRSAREPGSPKSQGPVPADRLCPLREGAAPFLTSTGSRIPESRASLSPPPCPRLSHLHPRLCDLRLSAGETETKRDGHRGKRTDRQ